MNRKRSNSSVERTIDSQMRSSKRKSIDTSEPESEHSKVPKNISTACDQCKKRKIKCNGETPCRRCHNLSLPCIYVANRALQSLTQSSEFQRLNTEVADLQIQVATLKEDLSSLQDTRADLMTARSSAVYNSSSAMAPSQSSYLPMANLGPNEAHPDPAARPAEIVSPSSQSHRSRQGGRHKHRTYEGPTSSTYDVDVAKSSLQRMGINGESAEHAYATDDSDERENSKSAPEWRQSFRLPQDPLWEVSHTEAIEATQNYEAECGLMYPLFEISRMFHHIDHVFSSNHDREHLNTSKTPASEIDDELLRLVLAIGLLLGGAGQNEVANNLYAYMEPVIGLKNLRPATLHSLVLLILTSTYLFHSEDEVAAWRLIGMAARACYELGLHRRETYLHSFSSTAEANLALRLFWITYALDRRWSFGTGMPFAIQDSDLDASLSEPVDGNPYLKYITQCNKIMSKIWSLNVGFESTTVNETKDLGLYDFSVRQWYDQLPQELKLDNNQVEETVNRGLYKLRVLLRLRANLAIIHVYRPILHSATNIHRNLPLATRAVDVARDTISLLVCVNQVSSIYRDQQVLYNYFLVQALAVIFLAISHAPAQFLNHTRKEFFEVLDLVRGFNMKSHASRRLWNTVHELKALRDQIRRLESNGPRHPSGQAMNQRHSSFSQQPTTNFDTRSKTQNEAMNRDSYHQQQPTAPTHETSSPATGQDLSTMDSLQMSNDLITLFEGVEDASFSILPSVVGGHNIPQPNNHPHTHTHNLSHNHNMPMTSNRDLNDTYEQVAQHRRDMGPGGRPSFSTIASDVPSTGTSMQMPLPSLPPLPPPLHSQSQPQSQHQQPQQLHAAERTNNNNADGFTNIWTELL